MLVLVTADVGSKGFDEGDTITHRLKRHLTETSSMRAYTVKIDKDHPLSVQKFTGEQISKFNSDFWHLGQLWVFVVCSGTWDWMGSWNCPKFLQYPCFLRIYKPEFFLLSSSGNYLQFISTLGIFRTESERLFRVRCWPARLQRRHDMFVDGNALQRKERLWRW